MALSYMTESEAPRDFRISTTESENHYTKCLLCYTIKKNFYCVDCIKAGNFLHSSTPYSDRFADKQVKLFRIKANRKHVQDRCETLLLKKSRHDSLQTEMKQCRNKIELIKLAIEQRRQIIEEKKKELTSLKNSNTELSIAIPRYQKRISVIRKHVHEQRVELENRAQTYDESAQSLAALRRSRIRQLTKYIFPVYITYDSSDSVEDMEFLHVEPEQPASRERLHVVAAWLPVEHDYKQIQAWVTQNQEGGGGGACSEPALNPGHRSTAALALAAQLTTLLAWLCDVRLPYTLSLNEFSSCRSPMPGGPSTPSAASAQGVQTVQGVQTALGVQTAQGVQTAHVAWQCRRVCQSALWLALAAGGAGGGAGGHAEPRRALASLHALTVAANTDHPALGSMSSWPSLPLSALEQAWEAEWPAHDDLDPPEHITWTETLQMEELSSTPPVTQMTPSLVTSAAASLASFLRGWAK